MNERYDVLALFSGGLDSILAARLIQDQGLRVLGLHFASPFFGRPDSLGRWRDIYGLDIAGVDISQECADLLAGRPAHGFGKLLNPCVDCKILMLRRARALMDQYGAKAIISGEVLGQRPMSQRRDALDIISRDAGVRDVLVRPLCAKKLRPTAPEESGLLDREAMLNIGGRGRKEQLAMARDLGLVEVPAPAGGCKLTEPETAKRYLPFLAHLQRPAPADYELCDHGRHYWAGPRLAAVGRRKADNERLAGSLQPGDASIKLVEFPGPLGLLRRLDRELESRDIQEAAALVASFSPKACREGGEAAVSVLCAGRRTEISVLPDREPPLGWREPDAADIKQWKEKTLAPGPGRPHSG
ncbi:MAG: tRNA(5-methylaminomethyl-2-thiouridylate) methyltransferase [Desulfovibrionaceae bacterium]